MAQHNADFNVKSEILSQLDRADDKSDRTMLLLMLGVLDEVRGSLDGVNKKLDDILTDERWLRDKVLNGLAPMHHDHHKWIEEHIEIEARRELICAWAAAKMETEQQVAKDNKTTVRKFIDAAVAQAGVILVSGIAGVLGLLVYLK